MVRKEITARKKQKIKETDILDVLSFFIFTTR